MVTNANHDLSIICYVKIWVKEGEKCGGRINIMFMYSHNFSFEGKIGGSNMKDVTLMCECINSTVFRAFLRLVVVHGFTIYKGIQSMKSII